MQKVETLSKIKSFESKSWISVEFYRAMFSAVLSSGLSLEKTPLPLSMNLLSNQKLDENTVKHHLLDLYPAILLAIGHMSNY